MRLSVAKTKATKNKATPPLTLGRRVCVRPVTRLDRRDPSPKGIRP